MADVTTELLKTQLRQLRLPTMGREFEKLARDAAATNQTFTQFLLRLTESYRQHGLSPDDVDLAVRVGSVELANVLLYSSLINQTVDLPMDSKAWETKLNELIANAIHRIHGNESISALFTEDGTGDKK